jgi:hypothetical protein
MSVKFASKLVFSCYVCHQGTIRNLYKLVMVGSDHRCLIHIISLVITIDMQFIFPWLSEVN